jgi:hypothetical protein
MTKKEPHLQVYTSAHKHIGHFDGEFFYTKPHVPLRVADDEVYTEEVPCKFVGHFKANKIVLLNGSTPYYFQE